MISLKPGRNEPCPCGSGKKFKQCCETRVAQMAKQPSSLQSKIPLALRTAIAHQQAGRLDQAAAIYQQVLMLVPNQPDALHLLGGMQLAEGRVDAAIGTITRAIKANPANFEAHNNLGFALHERGRLEEAVAHYRQALQLRPDYAGARFNLHALLLQPDDVQPAIDELSKVIQLAPRDEEAQCMLAVLLDYAGQADAAQSLFDSLEQGAGLSRARVDAWRYLKSESQQKLPIVGCMRHTFERALLAAPQEGMVLEFGVRFGNTIRQIAELVGTRQQVHGFDSFEGLPEAWHQEGKGSYSTRGEIPAVPKNVALHAGWFSETLPLFLEQHSGPVRMINVDCDIYSSTKTVLELLAPRMVAGSVLVFDEYIWNEQWREDEFKAFQEAVVRFGWRYEYLCFSPFTKQVAVRLTEVLSSVSH